MDSFVANSHAIAYKQRSLHNTVFTQLESFYELLKSTKETLSDGKRERKKKRIVLKAEMS